MNTRFLFIIFLFCNTFFVMGQLRIEITEQNRQVCPTRGGIPNNVHYYSATIPDTVCNSLRWEFTRTVDDAFYNRATWYPHTIHGVEWSTPIATYNVFTNTWTLPRGMIRVTTPSYCSPTQIARDSVVLLSVRGLRVPYLRFGGSGGRQMYNNDTWIRPLGNIDTMSIFVPAVYYPNTTKRVLAYGWSIPSGWRAEGRGDDTTFIVYLFPQDKNHTVRIFPDRCSGGGGTIRVRPLDFYCRNEHIDSLAGAWITIDIDRPTPSITSITATPNTISWDDQTSVTLRANVQHSYTVERFEWQVLNNAFVEQGTQSEKSSQIILTHNGCEEGRVRVRAIYCGNRESAWGYATVGVTNPTATIQGSDILGANSQQYSVQNLPAGATTSWTLGPYIQRGTSSENNILLSPNIAEERCESSWIRASISRNGCTFQLPQRNIHVGFPPSSRWRN